MIAIKFFLPDTTTFKASIVACILNNLRAEEVNHINPQIDQFETLFVFEDSRDHLYLTKTRAKKFAWRQNYFVAVKEFKESPAGEEYKGEAITVTLYKKPNDAKLDIITVCEVTFINHWNLGLLRKIWLTGYDAITLEEIDSFELARNQFLRSFVLFLEHKSAT